MIESIATWILTYALHSALTCGIALMVTRSRRIGAASRCIILRSALFLPLLTASLSLTALNSAQPLRFTTPARRFLPIEIAYPQVNVEVKSIAGSQPQRAVMVKDQAGLALAGIVFALTSLCAIGGLALWLERNRVARKALLARTPIDDVFSAAARRGIQRRSSPHIGVPVALRNREICVPVHLGDMPFAEQESVVLHEVAHIDRHDPAWMDAARLIGAVTWWQPLNRLVCERLECETEIAADEHAIAIGAEPRALVSALAKFSSRLNDPQLHSGAALIRGRSPLVTRATLLLEPTRAGARISSTWLLAIVLGMAGVLIVLPTPTTIGQTPSFRDVEQAGERAMLEDRHVTFIKKGGNPPR